MSLRQAAQQALEAWFRPHGINYVDFKPYMEALRAALAEPEQIGYARCPRCWEPITAATPRKPLTDEELEPLCDAVDSYDITQYDLVKFARAIERAHGITGEQT